MAVIETPQPLPKSVAEWQAVLKSLPPEAMSELKKLHQAVARIPKDKQAFLDRKVIVDRITVSLASLFLFLEIATREGKFPAFVALAACVFLATQGIERLISSSDKVQVEELQRTLLEKTTPEVDQALNLYPHTIAELMTALEKDAQPHEPPTAQT